MLLHSILFCASLPVFADSGAISISYSTGHQQSEKLLKKLEVNPKGDSLKTILEEVTQKLTVEERAQVDLVELSEKGMEQKILLPRALIGKVSKLGVERNKEGKVTITFPQDSGKRFESEGVFLPSFTKKEFTEVRLTSYSDRYGKFLLKRRTDPAAMRGEKLFVQNCLGCHTANADRTVFLKAFTKPEEVKSFLMSEKHVGVSSTKKWESFLDSKRERSLLSYLMAQKSSMSTASK